MDKSIGQKIRKLRKERGMTLVDLAGEEFTKGYISQVELGRVEPSFKLLGHMADKLGLGVDKLIGDSQSLEDQVTIIENEYNCVRYEEVIKLGDALNLNSPSGSKIGVLVMKAMYHLNRYEESMNLGRRIQAIKQRWSSSFKLEAYAYIGLSMFALKKYKDVIDLYNEAFEYALTNDLGHVRSLANMHLNMATAYQNLDLYEPALLAYQETLDFASAHDCNETVIDVYLRMGYCYYKLDYLKEAKRYLHDALKVNSVLGNKQQEAETLLILSYVCYNENNFSAAETLLRKSLVLFEDINRSEGKMEVLFLLTKVYQKTNRIKEGKDHLLDALALIESIGLDFVDSSLLKEIAKVCMTYELHEMASKIYSSLMD